MNIAFLAHLNPYQTSGGGEVCLRGVLEGGRERGHHIEIFDARSSAAEIRRCRADLYFLADVYNCPWSRHRISPRIVKAIIREKQYIHFDNAYVDVCDMDYLPCNGDVTGEVCPFKANPLHLARRMMRMPGAILRGGLTRECPRTAARQLYRNSLLNVFVSPLHRRTMQKLVGECIGPYLEFFPPVDPALFNMEESVARDIQHLFVGAICEAKGLDEMRARFPNGDLTLAGAIAPTAKLDFGRHLGMLPAEAIPGVMRRAEALVMLPRWPEPFGRVAVEARFSGCRLVANDRVGSLSFAGDLKEQAMIAYRHAIPDLWRSIEDARSAGPPVKFA